MSDQTINNNANKDIEKLHIAYMCGLIAEGIKNFHEDMLLHCKCAPDIMRMGTYLRVLELRDKLEIATLI